MKTSFAGTDSGPHPPRCDIESWSQDAHLAQVYTGFAMLAKDRRITLRQRCLPSKRPEASKPQHLRNAAATHVRAVVNGSIRLYYDTHDAPEIDEQAAAACDLYFKRSFSPEMIPHSLGAKVRPLGLNYAVYPDGFDRFELQRALVGLSSARERIVLLARLSARAFDMRVVSQGYRPTVMAMHAEPRPSDAPRVLFMARAWDPADQPDRERPQQEERAEINETRARCVVMLRKEFGAAFTGGFKHTPYALEHYRHVLLDDPALASKKRYLGLLASHPICVATTGLHGSIGWKLGEYVAFSKAVVSERLSYSVPGNLTAGRHYLEFRTAEECVDAAVTLFKDHELRRTMMRANHEYYEEFLRPDRMIARTLEAAIRRRLS
jgi:hypothetical protein